MMIIKDGLIIYEKKNRYKFIFEVTAVFILGFVAILTVPSVLNNANYLERLMQMPYPIVLCGIYILSLAGNIGFQKVPETYIDVTDNGIRIGVIEVHPELRNKYALSDSIMYHYYELEKIDIKKCIFYKKDNVLKINGTCERHYKTPYKSTVNESVAKLEVEKNTFFKLNIMVNEDEWRIFKEKTKSFINCAEFIE